MNKKTPVPGYRLLSSPSTKLKLKDNHYETPCTNHIYALPAGRAVDIRQNPTFHLVKIKQKTDEKTGEMQDFRDWTMTLLVGP